MPRPPRLPSAASMPLTFDAVDDVVADAAVDVLEQLLRTFYSLSVALRTHPRLCHDVELKLQQMQRTKDGPLTEFLAALVALSAADSVE